MNFTRTSIPGCWILDSKFHRDERGAFLEWFKKSEILDQTGISFTPNQANFSISKKNVLRGLHFSASPKGQSKLVFCASGKIRDYLVNLDIQSLSYGKWISVELSPENGKMILVGPNIAHGFLSLEDNTIVTYLLSSEYNPELEFEVNFRDPDFNIQIPESGLIQSQKDSEAPNLKEIEKMNKLPVAKQMHQN